MKDIIYVNTGEVKFAKGNYILHSGAIGSCIVITMFDSINRGGGMAHVMLPGRISKSNEELHTKYAVNAIGTLVEYFSAKAEDYAHIVTCVAGGGNVLQRADDTICTSNILSVNEELASLGIKINAQATGGTNRRTVRFDVESGAVFLTEGDSLEKLLWQSQKKKAI